MSGQCSANCLLLTYAQLREYGQGDNLGGELFGNREISATIAEGFVGFLEMQRDGVVDSCSDAGGSELFH